MTKTKKKKMTKSTFAIIIMAVVMVAMLAFGGTYAYFTATAKEKTTTFTTGSVQLDANEATFTASLTDVVPGDSLTTGALTLETTSTGTNSYVAIRFTISAGDAVLTGTSLEDVSDMLSATPYDGSTWVAASGTYPGVYVVATGTTPTKIPTSSTINITDAALVFQAEDDWVQGQVSSTNKLMNATITITVEARSVQSDNFTATTADNVAAELFA